MPMQSHEAHELSWTSELTPQEFVFEIKAQVDKLNDWRISMNPSSGGFEFKLSRCFSFNQPLYKNSISGTVTEIGTGCSITTVSTFDPINVLSAAVVVFLPVYFVFFFFFFPAFAEAFGIMMPIAFIAISLAFPALFIYSYVNRFSLKSMPYKLINRIACMSPKTLV